MNNNNSKGQIPFFISVFLSVGIIAAAMIYFDDKVLEELTSVREVLFDGAEPGIEI